MIAVLACEAPLTPDEEEARDWLLKELSRVEYSEAPSPVVRFVEAIIRWFTEALSWKGQGAPPISLILMIIAIIAIAGVIIALILNPIRLARKASRTVFEEEASLPEATEAFDQAVAAQDWSLAYVWAYRLMVLGLDEHEVVSSTPGLTAHEAARAATRVVPDMGAELAQHAREFDAVRYGHSSMTRDQVEALRSFTRQLLPACARAKERS